MLTWWLARPEERLPGGTGWLTPAERSVAARMRYAKRRTDFLLSRWTLKLAVARILGWPADDAGLTRIEARSAADGAPELFADGRPVARGISLTDRAGWAACLVADRPAAIGCDLELVEPRSDAFVRDYLTDAERDLVLAAGQARDVAANLIWSAKESALKVLRTGLRRDTRSVEVTVRDLMPPEHAWSPLLARTSEDALFPGWWRRSGPFVLTACASGDFPRPAPLETASPLDQASPSHRWLDRPLA
ncbi:MAG TPA: 4'-phosphopantetheinyl transferase superfamily protein [Streptosporangiaceae bacterium]|nr:4'-phosphopantetheinyl transferase superfamily protein [Streptosporangiaceae bacterium]